MEKTTTRYGISIEHFEARKGNEEWTPEDMYKYGTEEASWRYPEELANFNDLKEAEKFFESQKRLCSSYYSKQQWELVEFDYLALEEQEYDEDGDFIQANTLDYYIAEI